MFTPDELSIDLVCPDCRRPLARIDQMYICSDGVCRRAYRIVDDLPVLVADEAHILDLAEWQAHIASHGGPHAADAPAARERKASPSAASEPSHAP